MRTVPVCGLGDCIWAGCVVCVLYDHLLSSPKVFVECFGLSVIVHLLVI